MIHEPTFIIAEAGVNHNGNRQLAFDLIDAAVGAACDAIKFQSFKAEAVMVASLEKVAYQKAQTDKSETMLDMVRKLEISWKTQRELSDYCRAKEIQFVSSPFDLSSVEFLANDIGVKTIKIPSGEITCGPLLLQCARSGCDLILSTGMSTMDEIEVALGIFAFGMTSGSTELPTLSKFKAAYAEPKGREALRKKVSLLHCTSEYPSPYNEINLRAMDTIREAFDLPIGLSDHSPGIIVPLAAVARGASIVEKHFTLDRSLSGPDHQASLEPHELKEMVNSIRKIEKTLGDGVKVPQPSELKNKSAIRKCLVAARDIQKGEFFAEENLTFKRPDAGISPLQYWDMLGKKVEKDYLADEVIR